MQKSSEMVKLLSSYQTQSAYAWFQESLPEMECLPFLACKTAPLGVYQMA